MASEFLILQDLLYCQRCGQKLGTRNDRGQLYYVHPADTAICPGDNAIPSREIDDQVWRDLSEYFVLNETQKENIAKMVAAESAPQNPVVARRRQIEVRLSNLEEMRLDGDIEKDRYRTLKKELEDELKQLPNPPGSSQPAMTKDQAMEQLGAVSKLLSDHSRINPERVNRIFRAMLQAIWVDMDTHKVVGYSPRNWSMAMFPPDKVVPPPKRR